MYPRTLDLVRAESAWITPPPERLVACRWCDDHAGDRTATAAHVSVAMPGALSVGDLLCDSCASDLDGDVARADAKAVAGVLL